MNPGECWFCGARADPGHHLPVDLRRDERYYFVVVGVYQRWRSISLVVPRCRRCRLGHRIEQVAFWVMVTAAVVLAMMLLAGAPSWAEPWELALVLLGALLTVLLWLAVRRPWPRLPFVAPRPERHLREYPPVLDLVADGWEHHPARP